MSELRIGVLGSGRGTNFQAILEACQRGEIPGQVVLVLSDVEGAPILERARRAGVMTGVIGPSRYRTRLEEELETAVARQLMDAGVGLVALAGYMRVIKAPLLRAFPYRIMNVHPSLLPAFPGLRAWEQALQYGAKVTGATVHFVDEGLDSGPIILQSAVLVLPGDTAATLHARIQEVEHRIYPEAIRLFAQGRLRVEGRVVRIE